MAQSTRWCFTVNNYTEDDERRLRELGDGLQRSGVRYLVYGREVAASGTPHLQGFIVLDRRLRLRGVRELLGQRGHYEVARGSSDSASDYCKKDQDFSEFGTLPGKSRVTPTVSDFCDWVRRGGALVPREVASNFPNLWLRYGDRMLDLGRHLVDPTVLEDAELNEWQMVLFNRLSNEADDRSVEFFVDSEGGKGKSFFCRWMLSKFPEKVQVLSGGKRDDIAHAIDCSKTIFLFNLPRGGIEFLQYSVLEQLKDRLVFSPKYNSTTKVLLKKVHVIVFCNEEPDMSKMSADRYLLTNL